MGSEKDGAECRLGCFFILGPTRRKLFSAGGAASDAEKSDAFRTVEFLSPYPSSPPRRLP
jgi:hypothetical protein